MQNYIIKYYLLRKDKSIMTINWNFLGIIATIIGVFITWKTSKNKDTKITQKDRNIITSGNNNINNLGNNNGIISINNRGDISNHDK